MVRGKLHRKPSTSRASVSSTSPNPSPPGVDPQTDSYVLEAAGRAIPYRVRRSARARRASVRISSAGVHVTVPLGVPQPQVAAFMRRCGNWIASHYSDVERRMALARPYCDRPLRNGSKLMYAGQPVWLQLRVVAAQPGSRLWLAPEGDRLVIDNPPRSHDATADPLRTPVEQWMRAELRHRATSLMAREAHRMGVEPSGLRIKTQRRRWGSCGPTGVINLNWRLAMAPQEVMRYVLVHELAHLIHRNHSRSFWAEVARWCPGYESGKKWLATNDVILFNSLAD